MRIYYYCPECNKKGVTLRLGSEEDWYVCRYCDWSTCNSGNDRQDVEGRAALAKINLGAKI